MDFERVVVLRGVSVRGNPQAAEWVRSFLLLFRSTAASAQGFRPYEEPYGSVMVMTPDIHLVREWVDQSKPVLSVFHMY